MRRFTTFSEYLTRASMLVLAGFLVGFALSGLVPDGLLRAQVLHCGVAGLIAVIGLHLVAQHRRLINAQRRAEAEAAQALQVVRCLTTVRQSLQDKVREIEGRPSGLHRADGRRFPSAPASREAHTS